AKIPAPDHSSLLVPPVKLRWTPDASILPESTGHMSVVAQEIVGQGNALKAIRLGLTMPGEGYNLFVSGPEGSGRETAVAHALAETPPRMQTPPALVAPTTLQAPEHPVNLDLPAGSAPRFTQAVTTFGKALQAILPQALAQAEAEADQKLQAFQTDARKR